MPSYEKFYYVEIWQVNIVTSEEILLLLLKLQKLL